MRFVSMTLLVTAAAGMCGVAWGEVNTVTPSTNEINRTNGWAHVSEVVIGPGYATLDFVSTRGFFSCFEYRSDGDTSQRLVDANGDRVNFNPAVTDGLYPYFCQNNSIRRETINAANYVEVRMVFGAEADERFDWTRFEVIPLPTYSCVGFEPPADGAVFAKKGNRTLPLRMTLLDSDQMLVWDVASPVVQVMYTASAGGTAVEIAELTYNGRGDDGNKFYFDGSKWVFNLSTKDLASGEYTITAVPGSAEYAIDPTCSVSLTIQ